MVHDRAKYIMNKKNEAYKNLSENEKHAHKILGFTIKFNSTIEEIKWVYEAAIDENIFLNDLECRNIAVCSAFEFRYIRKSFKQPKQKNNQPTTDELLNVWNFLREAVETDVLNLKNNSIHFALKDVNDFYRGTFETSKQKEKEPLPADLLTVWNLLREANECLDFEIEEKHIALAKRNVNEFYKD